MQTSTPACPVGRETADSRSLTSADALTIVDAVTSLGGTPVLVDEWGVDAIYSAEAEMPLVHAGPAPVSFSRARG